MTIARRLFRIRGLIASTSMRNCVRYALLALAISGCSGSLPEPGLGGVARARIADVPELMPPPGSRAPAIPQGAAARYATHRLASYGQCTAMESRLDAFALELKTSAASRTLWGAVATAFVGSGGSIATAVSSSQQTVGGNGSNINGKDLTTVLGAVTAGTTAVVGAITIAVIGPPPADTLTAIDTANKQMVAAWTNFDAACPVFPVSWTDDKYLACSAQADQTAVNCTVLLTSVRLKAAPYKPPPDAPLAVAAPAAPGQ